MKMKTFKEAQVRDLLNQVHKEQITFSRMVEIMNYLAAEKMLIEVNEVFELYANAKRKEGGYCKILRNKQKGLKQYLFKGDEKLEAAWNVAAGSVLNGWDLKAKKGRAKLGLSLSYHSNEGK